MKNRRNYYRILHVQPDAPREVIRSSYRTIMQRMRMHPDLGGDEASAALLNEAYTTLTNAANRSAYDKSRQNQDWTRRPANSTSEGLCLPPPSGVHCAFCRHGHQEDESEPTPDFCARCQSPLFLPPAPLDDKCGRRSIARIPNNHPLTFCTGWPQSEPHFARADDISLNGMKFHSDTRLKIEEHIKIDSSMLKAVARVTRSQANGSSWETGVQFLALCFTRKRGSFIEERV